MKNLSLILNIILLAAVAVLFYLVLAKKPQDMAIVPPASAASGMKIAWVNADTLDARYEWLKEQKKAIEQRAENAEKSLRSKEESLMRDMAAFEQKAQSGNVARADLEKEYATLGKRQQNLQEESQKLGKQLSEEQKKAFNELYANVEIQLKTLSSQIGYDYIFSYSRGGQILLANDSLEITNQVLDLLNAKKQE
ncbi:MAG: OmpH family outer membrane protein [Saprospiraceae bacterium]|nr:OmpH family outer membrane protein [Saprospiraceae bacterium]